MSPEEFATRTRKRLRGPGGEKVAAAIIADSKQLMAWGIEQHAHPPYPPPRKREAAERDAAGGER